MRAIEKACDEIDGGVIQGQIRHTRCFSHRCLASKEIARDVDDALFGEKQKKTNAYVCMCKYFYACEQSKEFSTI